MEPEQARSDARRCYRPMKEKGPFSDLREKVFDELSRKIPGLKAYILVEAGEVSYGAYDIYFAGIQDNAIYWAYADHSEPKLEINKKPVEHEDGVLVSALVSRIDEPVVAPPPAKRVATNARCEFVTIENKNARYFFIDMQSVAFSRVSFPDLVDQDAPELLSGERSLFEFYRFLKRQGMDLE
jgi:hypothetical protein